MSVKLIFFNATIFNCLNISSYPTLIGKNKCKILILCNNFDNSEIYDFLKKILAAVNTNLDDDTAILNIKSESGISWSELIRSNKPKKVIFFGIKPDLLGLHIRLVKYQLIKWNEMKILYCDGLEQIMPDKNIKSLLWRELQQMFEKA